VEYGLAKAQGLGLAAMQNSAGNFVRPNEVLLMNITEVFGNELQLPDTIASDQWSNVSLMSSSQCPPPCPLWRWPCLFLPLSRSLLPVRPPSCVSWCSPCLFFALCIT
jgi:hypothetical protein